MEQSEHISVVARAEQAEGPGAVFQNLAWQGIWQTTADAALAVVQAAGHSMDRLGPHEMRAVAKNRHSNVQQATSVTVLPGMHPAWTSEMLVTPEETPPGSTANTPADTRPSRLEIAAGVAELTCKDDLMAGMEARLAGKDVRGKAVSMCAMQASSAVAGSPDMATIHEHSQADLRPQAVRGVSYS